MKMHISIAFALALVLRAVVSDVFAQPSQVDAVLSRMSQIQAAAESLNPDSVFAFVAENNSGALLQNGAFFLTRQQALESIRRGFEGLLSVEYHFDRQFVTMLSDSVALVTGEGSSTARTSEGRDFTSKFVQSVVLVLMDGEWVVVHSHRSFAPR